MLDPFTAVSLASSVVQFTDFGIKLVIGSIELHNSANGLNAERSNLELKTNHVRKLADKVIALEDDEDDEDEVDGRRTFGRSNQLSQLAKACNVIAEDLLSVLDDLKVKKLAGAGRKWESFRKAVTALTPHNKNKIATLETKLRRVQEMIFNEIQLMMR